MGATEGWRQLGGRPARRRGRVGPWVGTTLVAAGGPVGWALRTGDPWWALRPWQILGLVRRGGAWAPLMAMVVIAALGAAWLAWGDRGIVAAGFARVGLRRVAAAAVAVGALTAVVSGPVEGIWLAAGLCVGAWAWGRRSLVVAAVLSVVCGVVAWSGRPVWWVAGVAVSVVVVPLVMELGGGAAAVWVDRWAAWVGRWVAWLLFGVVSVPLVVVPGLVGRLVASSGGFGLGGGWGRPPVGGRGGAGALWANDRPGRVSYVRGVVRVGVPVLAAGLVAGVVMGRVDEPVERGFVLPRVSAPNEPDVVLDHPAPPGLENAPTPEGATPAAHEGERWWNEDFRRAENFMLDWNGGAWRFENAYRVLDFHSRYINVDRGLRRSWRPPACGCRRLKVWLYGGSTTWGIGQRDEHTIASELARVASEHGMTVDVQNRGLPGLHQWMESERFAWDLQVNPRPDLVVFYDGVNDRWWQMGLFDRILEEFWLEARKPGDDVPPAPRGALLPDPPTAPHAGIELAADGVRRWDVARRMSQATSEATGVPVRYVWQPDRFSRPFESREPHFDTEQENAARRSSQFAADHLASDVIDLTGALDDVKGPIFTDDVHHNERGARAIAEKMFDALEPQLRQLAEP